MFFTYMKRMLKLMGVLASALMLTSVFPMQAAEQGGRTVKGVFVDSTNGDPVAFATVSLTRKGADKPLKYILTDSEGRAQLDRVPHGTYVVKVELLGYQTFQQEVEVKEAVDLGTVKMEPDRQQLDAASVSAVGNPIVIKKDTVEYNASSYLTTDNDMLEELLKKLPGVEVSEDGTITSNGETITKITIDGRTFFLDDPQLASKNLPAKIIEKVKVVKKKSEQAEFTGIDDGEEEYVIDLSVKKGMMNGLLGNLLAGAGHDVPRNEYALDDTRYEAGGFVGRFTDKNQFGIILNANNTNNRGFNDLAGSMMQGMRGGGGGMGRGQGGWGGGNGILSSRMIGGNAAWTLFDGDMDLGGNYVYNDTDRYVEEKSYKETYLNDGSTLISNNDGFSNTGSYGHRFGVRLDHKFSENTSILFQPSVNFGGGNFQDVSLFETDNVDTDGLQSHTNKGFSGTAGDNRNVSTGGFLLFRQRLGIPGRTISLMSNWNFSNNDIDGLNQSSTYSYADQTTAVVNQRYDQNQRNRSLSARVVYTEPIGHNLYLEGNYSYSWRLNTSYKDTYDGIYDAATFDEDHRPYNREGETYNELYSNSIHNRSVAQSVGANLAYQEGDTRAQIGISVNPTSTHNVTKDGSREQTYENEVVNWAPQAMVFHDFNDKTELRLFYRGRSSQPSTSQLMAVMDNSNPLNLSFGNPSLYPYFNHGLRAEFNYSNRQSFFTIRNTLEGNMVQNPIVNAVWYDDSGVQYAMPVNGDNSLSANYRMFLSWPIAKSNFTLSMMSNVSYNRSGNFVGESRFSMDEFYNEDGSIRYEAFVDAFSDIRSRSDFINNKTRSLGLTERIRVTYRLDNLEISASGRTRMSKPWYTIATASENTTWGNQAQAALTWNVGRSGFTAKANASYNWYRGYTTPRDDEYIVNAEINKLLFKNRFTVGLKMYDILAQAKNLSVSDLSNYHQEVWNNTLGRYVILSLTWRFGTFGGRNGGRGPGGPGGGPGRGPGGPPRF